MKGLDRNKRFQSFIGNEKKSISDQEFIRSNYKKRFFNIDEVAEYLNISKKTIYNKLSLGTFPVKAKRFGKKLLFEVSDIEAFANSL